MTGRCETIARAPGFIARGKPLGQATFCARDQIPFVSKGLFGARQNEPVPGFRVADDLKIELTVISHLPHIMLLHDNPLNADTVEEVVELFEERGYRFVSLAEGFRDPAYAVPEICLTKFGSMWGLPTGAKCYPAQ